MSRRNLQDLIKNLQQFYKCPACDTSYHLDDIKFLGQIDTYCFVQLGCHQCSLPVLATVPIDGRKVRPKSELRVAEQTKFAAMGQISSGEIADFHRFISVMRGGLKKLS